MHEEMLAAVVVRMPVHGRRVAAQELLAIHAYVAIAGLRVAGENLAKSDESPGVLRPALDDRKLSQVHLVGGLNHFLTRARSDHLGWNATEPGQNGHHLQLVEKTFGHFGFDDFGDALGHFFKVLDAQGLGHAPLGAEHVNGQGIR